MTEKDTYDLLKEDRKNGVAILYNRYGRKLYAYGIKQWRLDEDATWELVYQTLYKVVETFERYEISSEKKFGSFIFKIFINYLRNYYRDNKKRKEQLEITSFNELNYEEKNGAEVSGVEREVKKKIAAQSMAEEPPESKEMKALRKVLDELEDWERVLLLLRGQNMPYSEIAKHVDRPENQLKVYYQRLKNKVVKKLNNQPVTVTKN